MWKAIMANTNLTNQRQLFVEEYVRSGDHLEEWSNDKQNGWTQHQEFWIPIEKFLGGAKGGLL